MGNLVGDLASEHGQGLTALAYLLCGDPHEAEDIVQAVLARLLAGDGVSRARSPLAYARRAVTNEFLDRRRRLQSRARALVLLRREPTVEPASDGTLAERDALLRSFAVLRPRERACIVLRYYHDWDDAAIAEAIGVAPATVRSLVSRSLPRLRAALEAASDATGPHEGDAR